MNSILEWLGYVLLLANFRFDSNEHDLNFWIESITFNRDIHLSRIALIEKVIRSKHVACGENTDGQDTEIAQYPTLRCPMSVCMPRS